ncbi:alpha-N-methyltransferase NTM1 [Dactylonectria estremocensis]|uniref:Alpha N-terminal protein methyltransferase 1 n=1 Tax=Dactylonectria estremocensis TaxID=1079267 RepID=A0A9P9DNT8_9HYPO|nr:alpha-N-methyltransferase NTM1 [Dactylonectria estremocensis]
MSDPTPDSLISLDDGKKYWEGIEPTVSGMLGGKTSVSRIDLQGSRTFLARLGYGTKNGREKASRALEGGAGIGRVTEGLLLRLVDCVDIIEPVSKFTDVLVGKPGIGEIYNVGLEGWQPAEGVQYDLIWIQWCAAYLPNKEFLEFLETCKAALSPDGVLAFKENISTDDNDDFDAEDSSVTRSNIKFQALFKAAGWRLVRTELQRGMPLVDGQQLLPVMMYALKL